MGDLDPRVVPVALASTGAAILIALLIASHQTPGMGQESWWRVCMGLASSALVFGTLGLFLRNRPNIKGEIETLEHHGMAQTGPGSYISEARLYVRLVNTGASSALFRWNVTAKDKYGNDVKILTLFSPSVMAGGEAPFRSMEDLKASPLKTGVGAVIPIGMRIEGSAQGLNPKTLRVSFEDAWRKRFIIGPVEGLSITVVGLLLAD